MERHEAGKWADRMFKITDGKLTYSTTVYRILSFYILIVKDISSLSTQQTRIHHNQLVECTGWKGTWENSTRFKYLGTYIVPLIIICMF